MTGESRNPGTSSFLWIAPSARAADLIAAYVSELQRRHPRRRVNASAVARALGLARNTVRAHSPPAKVAYEPGWRPVLRGWLAVRCSVAGRVVASHIERRNRRADAGRYRPTIDDLAADLGWPRLRVRHALAAAMRAGILEQRTVLRRGSMHTVDRKACHELRKKHPGRCAESIPAVAQKASRPLRKKHPGRCAKSIPVRTSSTRSTHPPMEPPPAPHAVGANPNGHLTLPSPAGWVELLSEPVRAQLRPGGDAGSLFAVCTAVGLFSDPRAREQAVTRYLRLGWTTETVLAQVSAVHEPRRGEGRVRDPAALLRVLLERGPSATRRDPVAVGATVDDAARVRTQAQQTEDLERARWDATVARHVAAAPQNGRERREWARHYRERRESILGRIEALSERAARAPRILLERCATNAHLDALLEWYPDLGGA